MIQNTKLVTQDYDGSMDFKAHLGHTICAVLE